MWGGGGAGMYVEKTTQDQFDMTKYLGQVKSVECKHCFICK